jgi:hypothetical protein
VPRFRAFADPFPPAFAKHGRLIEPIHGALVRPRHEEAIDIDGHLDRVVADLVLNVDRDSPF